ncbi:STAS/SEC14 domain-containing protein [Spirosoma sp. SC4-14]|uniref:STAS/SEC14 domain-containing protein n=1 Tax=Spirosoma sp. SC4-14 TaxID=3128900 RepID=UPI0030CB95DF
MIKALDLNDDRILGYRIEGKITAAELKPLFARVEEKKREHKKMRVYAEYVRMNGLSLGAIWEDIKFDITHFTDFEKVAVVTDTDWVGITGKAAGLIPGLEVRLFSCSEQEQAHEWIKA